MKILNYREGFAANSSSTHSTYFTDNPDEIKEKIYNECGFGWEHFIIKDKKLIRNYLAAQTLMNISEYYKLPNVVVYKFIKEAVPGFKDKKFNINSYYVDHQSVWTLPPEKNQDQRFPSMKFIQDLTKYLDSHNTIIEGGNDNSDDERHDNDFIIDQFSQMYPPSDIICSKDPQYGFWTFFNIKNGNRVVFSFDPEIKYTKSSVPQLVDLIISDQCFNKCDYCYRGCGPDGKFAHINQISDYLYRLNQIGTLEIAIGGGDLLCYPFLDELCECVREYINNCKLAINTTIRIPNNYNKKIHKILKSKIERVVESFNSVAFSISDLHDLTTAELFMNYNSSVQLIPEIIYNNQFKATQNRGINITLLGLKKTGRAAERDFGVYYERTHNNFNWLDIYKQMGKIRVDTQLLSNFPELKDQLQPWMYTEHEGSFSCCINAINDTIAKSSYDSKWFKLNDKYHFKETIKKHFDNF